MPRVEVTPVSAIVPPGKSAKFTVVFYDNGGNKIGPTASEQIIPRIVSGKGVLSPVSLKKDEGAVFTFRPYSLQSELEVTGQGVIDVPRISVNIKPDVAVMPNSCFECVSTAVGIKSSPVSDVILPDGKARDVYVQDLAGKWLYTGEKEKNTQIPAESFTRADFDDSGWAEIKIPSNLNMEIKTPENLSGITWLRKKFRIDAKTRNGYKRFRLIFESVDCASSVWMNGRMAGSHEGSAAPFELDVTPDLIKGENLLVVRLSRTGGSGSAGGILRPVKVVGSEAAGIQWVRIDTDISKLEEKKTASIRARHYFTNASEDDIAGILSFSIKDGDGACVNVRHDVCLPPGPCFVDIDVDLAEPKLWWPWDHLELGKPHVYEAVSTLFKIKKASGKVECVIDSVKTGFGIREICMRGPDQKSWQFDINGKRIFLHGTKLAWEECPILLEESKASGDIMLARTAHFNSLFLDVHPSSAFNSVADREGMLIAQEIKFTGKNESEEKSPDEADSIPLSSTDIEMRRMAETLIMRHNHPSSIFWSAGDEVTAGLLENITKRFEAGRPVLRIAGEGESNNPFISSVIQTVPYSAEEFLTRKHGLTEWPPRAGDENSFMNVFRSGIDALSAHIGAPGLYEEFHDWAFASQIYQSALIKKAAENLRLKRYSPLGAQFISILHQAHPLFSESLLDQNRDVMMIYRWLTDFNAPLSVIVENGTGFYPGGQTNLKVYVVNDLHAPISPTVKWELTETENSFVMNFGPAPTDICLMERSGPVIKRMCSGEMKYELGRDIMSLPKTISFDLPVFADKPRHFNLELSLLDKNQEVLAVNSYQICVAGVNPKSQFKTGLSPSPRFSLTLAAARDTRLAGAQKYNIERRYKLMSVGGGMMFGGDKRVFKDLPPGAYMINFLYSGKSMRKNIIFDCDKTVVLE